MKSFLISFIEELLSLISFNRFKGGIIILFSVISSLCIVFIFLILTVINSKILFLANEFNIFDNFGELVHLSPVKLIKLDQGPVILVIKPKSNMI